ncbi:MAG: hypothetical protein KF901_27550 [Myxococcales bacterium]|nr:hypothetical protein [Myxococcales bacterium]
MRAWLGVALALGVTALGCGEDVGSGPQARIRHFTGCEVPAGAVRVHEHLSGDAERFVMYAKVVIPKGAVGAYVASCGHRRDHLRSGYDIGAMAPDEPLAWWTPPDRQLVRGGKVESDGVVHELFEVERDTDFAVYVRVEGRARR